MEIAVRHARPEREKAVHFGGGGEKSRDGKENPGRLLQPNEDGAQL